MFKKILAAIAVSAALLLSAPVAANAVDYTQGAPCRFDSTVVQAGGTATLICVPGTWAASETVDWTASGENGANIVMVSSVTFAKVANGDGSDVLKVTLPADAVGTYSVVGHGRTSDHTCPASLTVLPADSAVSVSDPGNQGLAATGSQVAVWAAWAGGGMLLIGLLVLAILAWARKLRAS